MLLLVAFILDWHMHGAAVPVRVSAWSWGFMGAYALGVALLAARFRHTWWIRWLSGISFAISALGWFSLLALLGTLFVQEAGTVHDIYARLGLRTVYSSFPFLVAGALIVMNLTALVVRRCLGPRPPGLGFLLTHAGLLLIFLAAMGGAGQVRQAVISLRAGSPISTVIDAQGRRYPLPAALTLDRYVRETYPPKFALVRRIPPRLVVLPAMTREVLAGYTVAVVRSLPGRDGWGVSAVQVQVTPPGGRRMLGWVTAHDASSRPGILPIGGSDYLVLETGETVLATTRTGISAQRTATLAGYRIQVRRAAGPALLVDITTLEGREQVGWVSAGAQPRSLSLGSELYVTALEPEVKAYRSYLTVARPGRPPARRILEVNRPLRLGHWRLYQHGDDQGDAQGARTTVLAVRDPALPFVYLGLACVLIGVAYTCQKRTAAEGEGYDAR